VQSDSLEKMNRLQANILSEEVVVALAVKAGFGLRNRKLLPFKFLLALVFGFGVEDERTLAGLQRFFIAITGVTVVSSAFQQRFTASAVVFFKLVYEYLLGMVQQGETGGLPMALQRFKDVLAIDGSVLVLKDKLVRHYRATRTNTTTSAAKLHGVMSLKHAALTELDVTSERYSERRFLNRFANKLAGHLLLFDLGYFKHTFFERLEKAKAFFVSRLKDSSNPYIVEVISGIRARKMAVGTRVDDNDFEGDVVELLVRLGDAGKTVFRLVGLRFPGTEEYRFYLTNLAREFTPADIAGLYSTRWQIELLFKELKSLCRLDQLPSSKQNTVLCLIYASLIAILVSRLIKAQCERRKTTTKRIRRTVVTRYIGQHALVLARAFLAGKAILVAALDQIMGLLEFVAADPNVTRRPSRIGAVTY